MRRHVSMNGPLLVWNNAFLALFRRPWRPLWCRCRVDRNRVCMGPIDGHPGGCLSNGEISMLSESRFLRPLFSGLRRLWGLERTYGKRATKISCRLWFLFRGLQEFVGHVVYGVGNSVSNRLLHLRLGAGQNASPAYYGHRKPKLLLWTSGI